MVKKLTKSTQCASNSYYLNCKQTPTATFNLHNMTNKCMYF